MKIVYSIFSVCHFREHKIDTTFVPIGHHLTDIATLLLESFPSIGIAPEAFQKQGEILCYTEGVLHILLHFIPARAHRGC